MRLAPCLLPYIVRVIDFQFEKPYAIILKYYAGGTLQNFLANNTSLPADKFAIDIVEALKSMHAKGIVHCDLKLDNILLTEDLHIKLTDAGIAFATNTTHLSPLDNRYLPRKAANAPWRYAAPEVLRRLLHYKTEEAITPAADVYSFGTVMWQLFTRKEPYATELLRMPFADLRREICAGKRILNSKHESIPKKWQEIIFACWKPIAAKRPSLRDIIEHIYTGEFRRSYDECLAERNRLIAEKADWVWEKMELVVENKRLVAEKTDALKKMVSASDVFDLVMGLLRRDDAKAVKYLRMVAEREYAPALWCMALCCGKADVDFNHKCWKPLSRDVLNADEMYLLHLDGGNAADISCLEWLRRGSKHGHAYAQALLGWCYLCGKAIPRDDKKAVKWSRLSADQECSIGQFNLGYCYEHGHGVLHDQKEAVKWFRRSAEQGNTRSQYNLGICCYTGRGVVKDKQEAVKWYRLSAEQGYAPAQFNLGACCARGDGVLQDQREAVKWFRLSAEQGNALAQFNLGTCCARGDGVLQDRQEAVKWFRLSAEQGHARSQYNLAVCYSHSYGVMHDEQEAVKWFRLSAEQGHAAAIKKLGISR
eukprot:TRINITY_DN2195_c0_g1_i2.p1 TRINITY_DN2195_c0_g1~~TRINITY_DN2195_c0_g1_i2.p1  ORF type:complete len:594 (-),score=105.54 TRINITY_DN2195_c0_g1_i2:36-1817(-)